MNTFFVIFLPNSRVNDSSKEEDSYENSEKEDTCSGHYVVLDIYKKFRHVYIYIVLVVIKMVF